jgi:hypothetical protein
LSAVIFNFDFLQYSCQLYLHGHYVSKRNLADMEDTLGA